MRRLLRDGCIARHGENEREKRQLMQVPTERQGNDDLTHHYVSPRLSSRKHVSFQLHSPVSCTDLGL